MKTEFFTKPCAELNLMKQEKKWSGAVGRLSLKPWKKQAHRSERRVTRMSLKHWEG